jgi:hypothetical protein
MALVSARESNLDGAPSAPLVVEPQAGDPREAVIARLTKQHIAAGRPPDKARRLAEMQVASMGTGYASAYSDRMADDPAFLENAARESNAADARHAQMESDYNAATGLPGGRPPAPDMSEFDVMQGDEPGTVRRWNAATGRYDTVRAGRPGLGQPPAAAEDEARAADDKAHAARLDAKYGPGTGAKWLEARASGRGVGTDVIPVIAPTDGELTARQDADARYTDAVSRPRWAREAGLSMDAEETTQMSDGDLRLAAAQKRAADKQARELQWRAQLMMNRGNYAGALALPGMDDAMRSAVLNQQNAALNANRAGGPINFGPNPLGVQAVGAQNAFQLLRSAEIGQGLGGAAGIASQTLQNQQRDKAAAYADAAWNAKPVRGRTRAARDRLMRDIDNRFGAGMGAVAAGLDVIDEPAQQVEAERGANPTGVGPPVNPLNPGAPLAAPSRPPGV